MAAKTGPRVASFTRPLRQPIPPRTPILIPEIARPLIKRPGAISVRLNTLPKAMDDPQIVAAGRTAAIAALPIQQRGARLIPLNAARFIIHDPKVRAAERASAIAALPIQRHGAGLIPINAARVLIH